MAGFVFFVFIFIKNLIKNNCFTPFYAGCGNRSASSDFLFRLRFTKSLDYSTALGGSPPPLRFEVGFAPPLFDSPYPYKNIVTRYCVFVSLFLCGMGESNSQYQFGKLMLCHLTNPAIYIYYQIFLLKTRLHNKTRRTGGFCCFSSKKNLFYRIF